MYPSALIGSASTIKLVFTLIVPLYGTVTLVAAKRDLRFPLAGDTLSSVTEERVRYIDNAKIDDIAYHQSVI